MEIFIIALNDSNRVADLEDSLRQHGLSWTHIEAVDGRKLGTEIVNEIADPGAGTWLYGRSLSNTEIGCSASHRLAYAEFLRGRASWALVLEDDAFPTDSLLSMLSWVSGKNINKPTVIQCFTAGRLNTSEATLTVDESIRLQRLKTYSGHTVAYLINRNAAELALAYESKIASRADWPPWAVFAEFWRTVPNVVLHGITPQTNVTTMQQRITNETRVRKLMRIIALFLGISYLRLRDFYPRGLRQYYKHAVWPPTRHLLQQLVGGRYSKS